MIIVKQVSNKTLIQCNIDDYLKQSDYYLVKEYKNSFSITSFHAWNNNYQRTSRKKDTQYIGKGLIKLLASLDTMNKKCYA